MKPSYFWHGILAVAAAIVSLDFVRTPFTNDVGIFMGVEHIADAYYPFPQGIDLAWEAKPVGNRLINYALLKLAQVIVPFADHGGFATVAKILVLLAVIAIAVYFAHVVGGEWTGWMVFFAFTTCINFCVMQAEYYAVLLAVLALAAVLDGKWYTLLLAGMLIFFIAAIKGITLFLFIPVLCGAYLLGSLHRAAMAWLAGGFCALGAVAVLLQCTVWPNMLPDLMLAPYITGVGRLSLADAVSCFVMQSMFVTYYIPVLLVGILWALLLVGARKIRGVRLAVFAAMWLVPVGMVIVHSEYFAYQFFAYVIPSLVTLILCLRSLEAKASTLQNPRKRAVLASMGPLVCLVMFAVFVLMNSEIGFMTETEKNFFGQQNQYAGDILARFNLSAEPSVLYLDAGVAPYYFMVNSSGRYICPLPLQRTGPEWDIWDQPAVRQSYADALAYRGTYIIGDGAFGYHDWLHLNYTDRAPLAAKLDREYDIVWTKGWTVYERKDIGGEARIETPDRIE